MSTVKVDKILAVNQSNPVEIPSLNNRMASAWVNFNASANPITIRGSHNVSSVSDHGVGDYEINYISSLSGFYVSVISGNVEASNIPLLAVQTQRANSVRVASIGWSGGSSNNSQSRDRARISVAVFGGQS